MWDFIISCGRDFKGPSMHDLRGSLLQKEVQSIEEYLRDFKVSWAKTGCTIMSDGWSDGKNRTIINFFVSCPRLLGARSGSGKHRFSKISGSGSISGVFFI
jgi:hypothetical protein